MIEHALVGYEIARQKIDGSIALLRKRLGQREERYLEIVDTSPPAKRRKLSYTARKNIGAAQRKRWAAWRANRAAGAGRTSAARRG